MSLMPFYLSNNKINSRGNLLGNSCASIILERILYLKKKKVRFFWLAKMVKKIKFTKKNETKFKII